MSSVITDLLVDLGQRFAPSRRLVIGGEAALANELGSNTSFLPTDVRELDAARVPTMHEPEVGAFASVLIPAPPDRDLLRRHLVTAAQALQPGGTLIICGANAEGGKSAVKDTESLFGTPTWSGYREKHRMAMFRRDTVESPEWATSTGIAPGTWHAFDVPTANGTLTLETQAGVFAGARIDEGTALLLDHLAVQPGATVLDVGCGLGILGITAALAGATVTMTDANLRAVQATQRNCDRLGLPASVLASDVYDHLGPGRHFDLIVSNPPFHRGKQVDFSVADRLIAGAPAHLHPGGSLLLVANAFLAYDKQLRSVFPRVEVVQATPRYHVLRASL